MRMTEEQFLAARGELLDEFKTWRPDQAEHGYADLMLDYKYWYDDGEYLRWSGQDVEAFLLDWVPRKVMIPDTDLGFLVAGTRDFLTFLDDRNLLARGSDTLARLLATVQWSGPEMARRMTDTPNFGMAKSLMSGVDPFEYEPEPILLPSRPEVEIGEAARIAESSLAYRRLLILHEYFSTPRQLTKNGHLKLADARHLVSALETRDHMDEMIGDRQFKTMSSEELGHLVSIIEFAKRVKVIRLYAGKLTAVKSWNGHTRPLEAALRLIDTTLELGSMAFDWASAEDSLMTLIEASTPSMLTVLYEQAGDYDQMVERITDMGIATLDLADVRPQMVETLTPIWFERNVNTLEDLGLVEWAGSEEFEEYGRKHRRHGMLSLTQLGTYWVQNRGEEYGWSMRPEEAVLDLDAPRHQIVEALSNALEQGGADTMVELLVTGGDPDRVAEMVGRLWLADHPATASVLEFIETSVPHRKVQRAAHRAAWKVRNR